MTDHNICDACETVAHCRKHGCIPFTTPSKEPAGVVTDILQFAPKFSREQEANDRAAWAKLAAKSHGWADNSAPPMADGRFETGWHESEFQTFMQGVRHGRS